MSRAQNSQCTRHTHLHTQHTHTHYAQMFDALNASASLDGGLAVAIPCELRGLEAAWRRYGRLPWARLVKPAAALARSGFAAHVRVFCTHSVPTV